MTEKEVIRELLKERGWSQMKLAEECGYERQSNIAGVLFNKNGMRVDILTKWLDALGCELVIRDKMGSGKEWKVKW